MWEPYLYALDWTASRGRARKAHSPESLISWSSPINPSFDGAPTLHMLRLPACPLPHHAQAKTKKGAYQMVICTGGLLRANSSPTDVYAGGASSSGVASMSNMVPHESASGVGRFFD